MRIICFCSIIIMLLLITSATFSQEDVPATDPNTQLENIPLAPEPGSEEQSGFNYNPQGARDPFKSLFSQQMDDLRERSGLAGMQISELTLVGIQIGLGKTAIMQGSDGKTYGVKEGTLVYDGKLLAIKNNRVIFEKTILDAFGREKEKKEIEIYLHRN